MQRIMKSKDNQGILERNTPAGVRRSAPGAGHDLNLRVCTGRVGQTNCWQMQESHWQQLVLKFVQQNIVKVPLFFVSAPFLCFVM